MHYEDDLPINIAEIDGNRVRKYGYASMAETVIFMEKLCRFLIAQPDPTIVPVYDFQSHGRQPDGNLHYTYDMEKLYRLPRDEKKIIQEAAHEWYDYGNYPSESRREVLVDGWKEYPDLMNFLERLMQLGRYTDINRGNIMLHRDGSYRVIDLESFFHTPLNHHKNMWFQCEPETSSQSANFSAL